jgi:putative FmdB family regulatory protein
MPIYEYRCERGHTFEVMQRMTDDPVTLCSSCEAPVQRVFHPVAVHFKGSGFYTTDYGKNKTAAAGSSTGPDSGAGSEPKKDSSSASASSETASKAKTDKS